MGHVDVPNPHHLLVGKDPLYGDAMPFDGNDTNMETIDDVLHSIDELTNSWHTSSTMRKAVPSQRHRATLLHAPHALA